MSSSSFGIFVKTYCVRHVGKEACTKTADMESKLSITPENPHDQDKNLLFEKDETRINE